MLKKLGLLGLVASAFIVVGCGGGGAPQKNEKVTINGTAVDELILNGKVEVTKPDSSLLVEGRTSQTDGTYTLEIANYTGPVIINVTCDANSSLLVGTAEESCPLDLEMHSVANANGERVTVNVSPLTDITYKLAQNGGTITKESIETASNQVAVMFGVDPIIGDPTKGAYADTIKAFHDVAAADESLDLFGVIDNFVQDANDSVIDNSSALIGALHDNNVSNQLQNGDFTIPANPASLSETEEVEKFIQEIRTQGTTMETYIDSEADDIGEALESVTLDMETAADYVVGITKLVMDARDENKDTLRDTFEVLLDDTYVFVSARVTKVNATTWRYSTAVDETNHTGTITLPEITDGMEYTFSHLNASFSGTLPYVKNPLDDATRTTDTQTVSLDIALAKSGDTVTVTLTNCTLENTTGMTSIESLTGEVNYSKSPVDNEPVFNYVKLHEAKLNASAGKYNATGTLTIPEYTVNSSLSPRGGIEEVPVTYFSIRFSCPSESPEVNQVSVEINGTRYTPDWHSNWGTQTSYSFSDIPGNLTSEVILAGLESNANCSTGDTPIESVSNLFYSTTEELGNSGFVPKKLTFDGSLKNTQTSGEINGNINMELLNGTSADLTNDEKILQNLMLKVNINGKLLMPNRPDTLINVDYETKSDNTKRHSVTASYTHGSTLLSLEGSIDKARENGKFTFSNGSGIQAEFIYTNDALANGNIAAGTGSLVTYNGSAVATIEERGTGGIIIKYLDGSVETLF